MTKTPGRLSSRIALVALALVAALPAQLAAAQCVADLNGDRIVNGADLGILLNAWGTCPNGTPGCTGDLDSDGSVSGGVDGADLGILLAAWGNCPGLVVPLWATLIEAQPDPAVVTDPALRAAIDATGLAWRVRDSGTQIEMLLIPPGTFQMGCVIGLDQFGCYSPELPVHQVTLTNAFYLGRYEVTQAQWQARMGSNPSAFQGANRPVDTVSWTTIQGYLSATGMRLPTEAEWEYACRAGTQTPFYNGSTDPNTVGSLGWFYYNTCSGGTGCGSRDVGLKAANGFGLHDMSGNVYEWVSDWYDTYPSSAQTDPSGPVNGVYRVFRGGCWSDAADAFRSHGRTYDTPGGAYEIIGFRVARNPQLPFALP